MNIKSFELNYILNDVPQLCLDCTLEHIFAFRGLIYIDDMNLFHSRDL